MTNEGAAAASAQTKLSRLSAGAAPLRKPGSIRRTSSIDISWPNGRAGAQRVSGRARDIFTPRSGGAPETLAEDAYEITLNPERTIMAIETTPPRPVLSRLVGARGGGGLRQAIAEVAPDERSKATPLSLILDDLSGASLVAGWAWSQWSVNWMEESRLALAHVDLEKAFRSREGICIGFAPNSSGLDIATDRSGTLAPDLRNPDDPEGWHAFSFQEGPSLRRARRIDVSLEGDAIVIESAFQDSASTPVGERAAVHEYNLNAIADLKTLRVTSFEAIPRVLPFVECKSAPANLKALEGTFLPELREAVLAKLRGVAGCTHLNDALRALADVPLLVERLQDA